MKALSSAQYENPEPVPAASQLCALPFVAAVAGYLASTRDAENVRVTLHRVMTRDGKAYLQQVCSYAGSGLDHTKAGRLFTVSEGIIGKAFSERAVVRTRLQVDEETWWTNYRADRAEVNDTSAEVTEVVSYLAIPFLGAAGDSVICVLYVEVGQLNAFTEPATLGAVLGMARGFCRLLDGLTTDPLPRFRNYPLPAGTPVSGTVTAYPRLQEVISEAPPQLSQLTSFNFAPMP